MNNITENRTVKNERAEKTNTGTSNVESFVSLPDINVSRVQLEKQESDNPYKHTPYFVLPAGGMHFAVPDLEFHNGHFANSAESLCSSEHDNNKQKSNKNTNESKLKSSNLVKKNSNKGSNLPYGLELTAGPGHKKSEKGGVTRKIAPPSHTLLASAAVIKSYFSFTQEKDTLQKESSVNDGEDTMKTKVMGLWHNMKYGWTTNMKTNFSRDIPIYLLGKVYHKTFKDDQTYDDTGFVCSNIEGFKRDFARLGWFTYRRKFPPLPLSNLTTDCGWGCMIRSGQMMMFTALSRHFLPRSRRLSGMDDCCQTSIHKQIMKFFCDDPSPMCPFSLHNLVLSGHKMNKKAGNWYGPSCVAHMFKDAIIEGSRHIPALKRIEVYVAQDGAVYLQDILDMCSVGECLCRKPSECTSTTLKVEDLEESDFSCPKLDGNTQNVESYDKLHIDCDNELKSASSSDSNGKETTTSSSSAVGKCGTNTDDVPLDLFVDLNRERESRDCPAPFGEAVAMRLRETTTPDTHTTPEERQTCTRCHGWKSCIIFIPVRLGGSYVNPIYYNCIYSLFLHDLCIGIIGGRPKHSLYFVGFQDDSLIHLDPHLSQDSVPLDTSDFSLSTYHCTSPRKLNISKMDPSATIGFYCHTRNQFYRLLEEVPLIAIAKDGNMDSPIFEFVDGRSKDVNGWMEWSVREEAAPSTSPSTSSHTTTSSTTNEDTCAEETEELVFD